MEAQATAEFKFLGDADTYTPPETPAATASQPDNEPKQPDAAPPATPEPAVTPAAPAEPVQPAAQPEPAAQPAPQQAPAQPEAQIDPYEALGIGKEDSFGRKLLEAYKAGDHENFLRVMGTDWDKVPDLEVVRRHTEQKYAGLAPEKRDFMVRRELGQYHTEDSFDPDTKQEIEIKLELEAAKIREGFKADQSQYKVPEPQAQLPPEYAAYEQQQKEVTEWAQRMDKRHAADPTVSQFTKDRVITFGKGEEAFTYQADQSIDPLESLQKGFVSDMILKDDKGVPIPDEAGKPQYDIPKWLAVHAIAKDLNGFLKAYGDHIRNLERKRFDAELINPGDTSREVPAQASGGYKFLGNA